MRFILFSIHVNLYDDFKSWVYEFVLGILARKALPTCRIGGLVFFSLYSSIRCFFDLTRLQCHFFFFLCPFALSILSFVVVVVL